MATMGVKRLTDTSGRSAIVKCQVSWLATCWLLVGRFVTGERVPARLQLEYEYRPVRPSVVSSASRQ